MGRASTDNPAAHLQTVTVTLGGQVMVALALAGLVVLVDARIAWSVLVGGSIAVIPGAYLAARAFRAGPGATPEQMLRAFYTASAMKIAMSAAMFVIAILALDVNFGATVGGYLVTTSVYWFVLLLPVGGTGRGQCKEQQQTGNNG